MIRKTILFLCLMPVLASGQNFDKTPYGIKTKAGTPEVFIEVEWFTPRTVRIVKSPVQEMPQKKSLSVISEPQKVDFKTTTGDNTILMRGKEMSVSVNTSTGVISFVSADGGKLLSETVNSIPFTPFNDAGNDTWHVYQGFDTDNDEGLYGLGQLQNGQMMQRGMKKALMQGNVEDVSPFIQSTKGYGLFWDNYSVTTYSDEENETSFSSEVGNCIDYYFMYGGNADGVIAEVRSLTGDVPMMPLWSYGFLQSKERYKSQEETVGVVRKYRELGIPLDCIIQDWQYWGHNYLWNAMDFRNPSFSNPRAMIDSIHGMNARMMISIWSSFGPATKPYRALDKKGLLFDIETWPQSGVDGWPPDMDYPSGVRVYDAYSPEARDIYWDYLNKGIFSLGMDGWWMDSTEPDHFNWKDSDFDHKTYLGTYRSVRNAYPLMTVGGVYDHQRAATSDKRVIILTRSGFIGQQRYAANVWSGDVQSSWDSFRRQVPAGLNFSLTGMPHWNSDLGGFFAGSYNSVWGSGDAVRNPMYQELYVRWLQFGVFCPMMRSHGTDVPREFYYYGSEGDPVYDALVGAVKLRYSLLPYVYSTSWDVSRNRSTFMRALFMDFVDDTRTWNINSEYMFGKSFLVAPVLHAQYTPELVQKDLKENDGWGSDSKTDISSGSVRADFTSPRQMKVYLPAGTSWYDYWTGELLDGGREVTVETTLGRIPLFVRSGSIIPLGPDVQYTSGHVWNNLSIHVYPGSDATFTLYDDEADNYNYEQGAYSEIEFTWDDSKRLLTIHPRKGSFRGMPEEVTFVVKAIDGRETTVRYSGRKMSVRL